MKSFANLKNEKIVIVGIVRDVSSTITQEVSRLDNLLSSVFGEVKFFVVESDSSDATLSELYKIKLRKSNFFFETLGDLAKQIPSRIERMVHCRNRYVEFIRRCSSDFSLVMVVDFDIRNRSLTRRALLESLLMDFEWDAIFANQKGRYFDVYALRSSDWLTADCYQEAAILEKKLSISRSAAKQMAIWSKMKRIPTDANPIEVNSAFGGLAIYRRWVFETASYSIKLSSLGFIESEHVSFNEAVRKAGGKLFIQPLLTNFSWNPHSLSSFSLFRRLDNLTRGGSWHRLRELLRKFIS